MSMENPTQSNNINSNGKNVSPVERTALEENDGGYGYYKQTSGDFEWVEVTNFTLEPQAFLYPESDDEAKKVVLTVKPAADSEDAYTNIVPMTDFNQPRKFRDSVCNGLLTTFDGGQSELNEIRKIVGFHDVEHKQETTTLGLHLVGNSGCEFVTPESNLTDEFVYQSSGTGLESNWLVEDFDGINEEEVAEFIRLITDTRQSDRILPILSWFYATTFTPHIRRAKGEMGALGVFGDTGAGKSSLMRLLCRAFGIDTLFRADSTKYVLLQQFAGSSNVPVVFDEYKPSDMQSYEVDRFHNLLRSNTKGDIEERGNHVGGNDIYKLEAPVAVVGEQSVQGAAEERRLIRVQLSKKASKAGSETREKWSQVQEVDVTHHAKYVHDAATQTDYSKFCSELWPQAVEYVDDVLTVYDDIDGLEKTNLQTMALGRLLFESVADNVGVESSELPSDEEWESAFRYIADKMGERERTSHTDEFLKLCATVARNRYAEYDEDFRTMNDGSELRIHVDDMHSTISKYLKEHDLSGYDLLSRAKDYKDRFRDLAEDDDSYIIEQRNDGVINRCYCIDLDEAVEQVDGVDTDDFEDQRYSPGDAR